MSRFLFAVALPTLAKIYFGQPRQAHDGGDLDPKIIEVIKGELRPLKLVLFSILVGAILLSIEISQLITASTKLLVDMGLDPVWTNIIAHAFVVGGLLLLAYQFLFAQKSAAVSEFSPIQGEQSENTVTGAVEATVSDFLSGFSDGMVKARQDARVGVAVRI